MIKTHRTIKALLAANALLMAGILVSLNWDSVRLRIAPQAYAQTTQPAARQQTALMPEYLPGDLVSLGYQIPQPSIIAVPKGEYVREMQVIDSAQAFIVRYDNRIEVYRVQRLTLDKKTYEERTQRQP